MRTADPYNIPWFNPREMDDATLTALATGRERLIADFLETVERRLQGIASGQAGAHWLVTGTRGAGKSYFLRYAQIRAGQRFAAADVHFVLLPEELRNVRAPHDLLDEIRRMLAVGQGDTGRSAQWRNAAPEQLWQTALQQLLAASPARLLVVGIENFANILKRTFADDVAASLLRKLMEHEPRLMIVASAVDGSFDERYDQRLFLQFDKHALPMWSGKAHRAYLTQRAKLLQREPSPRQLARIDAYSHYTGGNARIAAILAAAILDEQDISQAGADLNATLDKMTDYYRSLLDPMPPNSETLFDALIRGGEPCSQTALAERVGARQNDISRAFRWLLDGGYLLAQRDKGKKETRYQVADRLFVQWYRMRYLNPGQLSRLAVLAELLADTLEFDEKWRYAQRFAAAGESDDALLMAQLGYQACGIDMGKLQAEGADLDCLLHWGQRLVETAKANHEKKDFLSILGLLAAYPDDIHMRNEFATALQIAQHCQPYDDLPPGKVLAQLCRDGLSLNPVEQLMVLRAMPHLSRFQWAELIKVYQEEIERFIELERDHPQDTATLRHLRTTIGRQFPWTDSWRELGERASYYSREFDLPATEVDILQSVATGIYGLGWATNVARGEMNLPDVPWEGLTRQVEKSEYILEAMDFLQQLLAASRDIFPAEVRGRLLCLASGLTSRQKQDDESLSLAKEAQTCLEAAPATRENAPWLAEAYGRIGWQQGQRFDWVAASASHRAALALRQQHENRNTAWDIGQIARYVWHVEGLAAAWHFLLDQPLDGERARIFALQQLGDAVIDVQRQYGPSAAYAKARELFVFLGRQHDKPLPGVLRALFIDMVSEGLALPTLRDLAGDLPGLIEVSTHSEEIAALAGTIEAWIVALQKEQEGGSRQSGTDTDPDWQLTLKALNEALPIHSRVRLGLTSPPQLGKQASMLFRRMMGFIRAPELQPASTTKS